jgi:hypothetical protein
VLPTPRPQIKIIKKQLSRRKTTFIVKNKTGFYPQERFFAGRPHTSALPPKP